MLDAYLLFADHDNDISSSFDKLNLFRARFIAAFIFNKRIVLSDAQILNSLNFRYLLQNDDLIRKIVVSDGFCFKIRRNNVIEFDQKGRLLEGETPLHTVQSVFRERSNDNNMVHIPDEIFDRKDDLKFLFKNSTPEFWSVWSLRGSFTIRTIKQLSSNFTLSNVGPIIQENMQALLNAEV